MKSLVLILPAALRALGNGVAVALGHDVAPGNTYVIGLAPTGEEPATHYGCHTWATDGFAVMIGIVTSGIVPDGTSTELSTMALGVRAQHPSLASGLIWSELPSGTDAYQHFQTTIAANSLQRINGVI